MNRRPGEPVLLAGLGVLYGGLVGLSWSNWVFGGAVGAVLAIGMPLAWFLTPRRPDRRASTSTPFSRSTLRSCALLAVMSALFAAFGTRSLSLGLVVLLTSFASTVGVELRRRRKFDPPASAGG